MKPFLNWPGGKRWLVSQYEQFVMKDTQCHIEPFAGSGAVFFHCEPKKAVLGDVNEGLIETYQALSENPEKVLFYLKKHNKNHCKEYYYHVRSQVCLTPHTRAARFIYLNRTCFNGIYRVNKKGEFNVPVGTKSNVLHGDDDFLKWSQILSCANIHAQDFRKTIKNAKKGDYIYADPPYTVQHNNNNFVKYNEEIFSWEDQTDLCAELTSASTRGVNVLISNANHSSIRTLYNSKIWNIEEVMRFSGLAASGTRRKRISEVLISNYLKDPII